MRPFSLFLAFLLFVFWPTEASAVRCKLISDSTLYLKGETDKKMLECVRSIDLSNIDTIVLKSSGGRVGEAWKIGELIAPLDAHMVVRSRCNSSCANFFLPLAQSVLVEEDAELLLHGSIDPGFGRKAGNLGSWELVDQQEVYAQKYQIHRGWLLYRNDYSNGRGAKLDYFDGVHGWPKADDKIRFFQVEQKLFESCFPDIDITFESPTFVERAEAKESRKRKYLRKGIRPTGSYVCKGPFDPNWTAPDANDRPIKSETP